MIKTRCNRCRTLIEYGNSYCSQCKSKVIKDRKQSSNKFDEDKITNTSRWRSIKREIKLRDNGICILCFKRGIIFSKSLEVHHIVKRRENPALGYEPSNLITVCKSCHKELEVLSVKKQCELLQVEEPKEEIYFLL